PGVGRLRLRAVTEAGHDLGLEAVVDRAAVLLPEGEVAAGAEGVDSVQGPQSAVARLGKGEAVLGTDLVQVDLTEQVAAGAADVGEFHRRVVGDLTLDRHVPLDGVGVPDLLRHGRRRRAVGGDEIADNRRRGVEGTDDRRRAGQRRRLAEAETAADALTLVEQTAAAADRHLAVAVHVPREAEARSEVHGLGGNQRAVRTVAATRQTQARA